MGPSMLQVPRTCSTACPRCRVCLQGYEPRTGTGLGVLVGSVFSVHVSWFWIPHLLLSVLPARLYDPWIGEGSPQNASTGGTTGWSSP